MRRNTAVAFGLLLVVVCNFAACDKTSNGERVSGAGSHAAVTPVSEAGNAIAVTKTSPRDRQPEVKAVDLQLELTYVSGENSKDSGRRTTRCKIIGNTVTYFGPHQPCVRSECEHSEVTFTITAAQINMVAAALDHQQLLTKFEEHKSTAEIGRYYEIQVSGRAGSDTASIEIEGMRTAQSARASALSDGVYDLRQTLMGLAKPVLAGAL